MANKIIVLIAYWGNGRDSSPFLPFAGGVGMLPVNSQSLGSFDKGSSSAQQAASNNMNASE